MQDLAGVRPRGQERVVAAPAGVAERGALLGAAEHLANERVDIDHEALVARAGASLPGTSQRVCQNAIELADVPERQRAQERAKRRGRGNLMAEQLPGPPGSQQTTVIDAVRAERHRRHQRHDLRAGVGGARPVCEPDRLVNELLDA